MTKNIVSQILSALSCLHLHGIAHRDIKFENIMLESFNSADGNENIRIKLTDFGFASFFKSDEVTFMYSLGTKGYQAPEIYKKGFTHNEKVDIWATAILTYCLLGKKTPFKKNGKQSVEAILRSEPDYSILSDFSD